MSPNITEAIGWAAELALAATVVWSIVEAFREFDRTFVRRPQPIDDSFNRELSSQYAERNHLEAQAAILKQRIREAKSSRTRRRREAELRDVTNQLLRAE